MGDRWYTGLMRPLARVVLGVLGVLLLLFAAIFIVVGLMAMGDAAATMPVLLAGLLLFAAGMRVGARAVFPRRRRPHPADSN